MSEGPIKAARDAWKPPIVSTRDSERACFKPLNGTRGYCGRKPHVSFDDWSKVTCSDCLAAATADRLDIGVRS